MSGAEYLEADVLKHQRRHAAAFRAWERSRSDADDIKTTLAYIGWARAQARLMDAQGFQEEAKRLRQQAVNHEALIAA